MATVQSIIERVTYVTKDHDHVRWPLDELASWINDAVSLIAEMSPRAASQYRVLTLAEGARQDLRTIDAQVQWIRLMELVCNVRDGQPTGKTIRQISRPSLDTAFRAWRSKSPTAREVDEYAQDEREPYTFDVIPPVVDGTEVYALVSIKPPKCAKVTGGALDDPTEALPLADGYDIPTVDFVLFRCFSKDTNGPNYEAKSVAHFQAFQAAVGVEARDGAAQ